jgi:hypothetical protein
MNRVEGAVEVPGIDDAVAIGLGTDSACVVRRAGSVVCWGSNRYGQLGAGDDNAHRGLVTVSGLSDAASVVYAGGFCAIRREGRVSCWGERDSAVVASGDAGGRFALVETTLRDVRALRLGGGVKFALLEGGRAMTWGTDGAAIRLHALSDVANAATASLASCVQNLAGEVRCHFSGVSPRDEEIASFRGAIAIRLAHNMVALMPDGTLVMHAAEGARRMDSATNIAQLAIESSGVPTAITRDGRVLVWSTPPTQGVFAATEITLPALGAAPAVAALPEGRIPRWCTIEAQWIVLSEPSRLEVLREGILGPPDDGEARDQASLCASAEVAYDSPDCPASGPWLAQTGQGELVLVVSRPQGLYAEIPDLASLSDGTEENASIAHWQLHAGQPLDAVLSVTRAEQSCLDEENFQDCGLLDVEMLHTALREVGGRFLRVTARVDERRIADTAETAQHLTLEVSGNTMDIWVCGGHVTRRLPSLPADTNAGVEETMTPASEAEAQAASAQCAEGWRAFGAGNFDAARTSIDAALTVLERAQDTSGIRARGACLYNRGRIAEQDQDLAAARGFYERSIQARPNEVVAQRLAGLPR